MHQVNASRKNGSDSDDDGFVILNIHDLLAENRIMCVGPRQWCQDEKDVCVLEVVEQENMVNTTKVVFVAKTNTIAYTKHEPIAI